MHYPLKKTNNKQTTTMWKKKQQKHMVSVRLTGAWTIFQALWVSWNMEQRIPLSLKSNYCPDPVLQKPEQGAGWPLIIGVLRALRSHTVSCMFQSDIASCPKSLRQARHKMPPCAWGCQAIDVRPHGTPVSCGFIFICCRLALANARESLVDSHLLVWHVCAHECGS